MTRTERTEGLVTLLLMNLYFPVQEMYSLASFRLFRGQGEAVNIVRELGNLGLGMC